MTTVALPIETKAREFHGKLWLGLNLVARGHDVVLGPANELKDTLHLSRPDVLLTKDPGDGSTDWFDSLRDAGITVCGLDTEGGVAIPIERWASNKDSVLDHLDAYFAWGSAHAEELERRYGDREDVIVTGNPRFDLLNRQLRGLYSDATRDLREEYGRFVLVNTNFTRANPFDEELQAATVERVLGGIDPDNRRYQTRNFFVYLEAVLYLYDQLPDHAIVVRPHPGENHDRYRDIFRHYDGIHVEHSGDVRTWIAGADAVLHYDCTTGIETALMGRPAISYRPLDDESDASELPQVASDQVFDREELLERITAYIDGEREFTLSDSQTRALKRYFHNVDENAAANVCDAIDDLDAEYDSAYERLEPSLLGEIALRVRATSLGSEYAHHYHTVRTLGRGDRLSKAREKDRRKFSGLTTQEVTETAAKIDELSDVSSCRVNSLPQTRNTYLLSPGS